MEKAYFISDIHLGLQAKSKEEEKIKKLLLVIDEVKKNKGDLFILGDLFDFWFEYIHFVQKDFFKVYRAFYDLRLSGSEIFYFIGNHDFAHVDFFEKELDIKIFCDPKEFVIKEKRFFIGHGDGLVENDEMYNLLKKFLRSKFFNFSYKLVHPDLLIEIAALLSKKSRSGDAKKKYKIEKDGLEKAAIKIINEGFDYVIFGHLHKMTYKKFDNSAYINLGSWLDIPKYGIFDGIEFKINEIK